MFFRKKEKEEPRILPKNPNYGNSQIGMYDYMDLYKEYNNNVPNYDNHFTNTNNNTQNYNDLPDNLENEEYHDDFSLDDEEAYGEENIDLQETNNDLENFQNNLNEEDGDYSGELYDENIDDLGENQGDYDEEEDLYSENEEETNYDDEDLYSEEEDEKTNYNDDENNKIKKDLVNKDYLLKNSINQSPKSPRRHFNLENKQDFDRILEEGKEKELIDFANNLDSLDKNCLNGNPSKISEDLDKLSNSTYNIKKKVGLEDDEFAIDPIKIARSSFDERKTRTNNFNDGSSRLNIKSNMLDKEILQPNEDEDKTVLPAHNIPSDINIPTPVPSEKPKEVETKPEVEKKSGEAKKKLSIVFDQALVRPIETVSGIDKYVDPELYCEPEKHITDADLDLIIAKNPDIKVLDLSFCYALHDFTKLAKLRNLEQLNLFQCRIPNTSFLRDLKNLKALSLASTGVVNIDDLAGLQYLQALNLNFNEKLMSIAAVRNFHDLRDLGLWGCGMLRDLSPLSGITSMQAIDLDATAVIDLSPLRNLINIEMLILDNSLVTDITPLANLTKMKFFTMDGAKSQLKESDLHTFEGLVNMKTLILKSRGIPSLKYFSNMVNMIEMQLADNLIMSLDPIANYRKLLKLDLSGNSKINNIDALTDIASLEKTNISGNKNSSIKISDLSPLRNMSKMDTFECAYNSVLKDISIFNDLPTTKDVNFSYCTALEDIRPLANLPVLENVNLTGCTRLYDLSPLVGYGPEQGEMSLGGTSLSPSSLFIFKRVKKFNTFKSDSIYYESMKKRIKILKNYRKKETVKDDEG